MKKVLLLGASGSIGKQTIDIINKHNNLFDLVGFSVGYNVDYIDELLTSFTNIKNSFVTIAATTVVPSPLEFSFSSP